MNDLEQNAMNSDFAEEVVNPVLIKNLKEEINMENKYYIIRGDRSGVFFGQIAGRNGQEVELRVLDRRLGEIFGDGLDPFAKRYPWLKEVRYGK